MSDDGEPPLEGPYNPTWTRRREIVRLVLGWLGVIFPLIVLFGADTQATVAAVWVMGAMGGLVVTYYLMGPSWQAWVLAKFFEGKGAGHVGPGVAGDQEDREEGIL